MSEADLDRVSEIRASFERWAHANWPNSLPPVSAWDGWKAGWAARDRRSPSQAGEPVTVTDAMVEAPLPEGVVELMMAAWNNVPAGSVSLAPANDWTKAAWGRVYRAALSAALGGRT